MTLVPLPVLLLGAVGFTLILTVPNTLDPVRRIWPSLLGCAMCSGFWIGIAAYYWNGLEVVRDPGWFAQMREFSRSVFHGGVVSAISYVSYCVVHLAGKP